MVFQRHPVYCLIHIALGIIGYFYPEVLYATLGYQIFQYVFNIRFFFFEGEIKSGNSLQHTAGKLTEVTFGYIIAMLCKASSTT
jgi:hypothetical protein